MLEGGVTDTGQPLPYRDEKVVDRIVGPRRKAVQIGTAFWDWGLWRRHRTWDMHLHEIAAKKESK